MSRRFCILLLCLMCFIKVSFSEPVYNRTNEWLPKCCPEGKLISGDGKSCVKDDAEKFKYNVTDSDNSLDANILTIYLENTTINYSLEHRNKFNCVRNEVYVVNNDIFVSAEDEVVVFDDSGEPWSLRRPEVCVDSVHVPRDNGLGPQRMFVALLCPSCERLPCIHKCCQETERLFVSEDGFQVDCKPAASSLMSKQLQTNSSERSFVVHGFPECPYSMYLTRLEGEVQVTGEGHAILKGVVVPRSEYCTDLSTRGDTVLLACSQLLTGTIKPTLYGSLFCVGSFFLALTLALHLWLPELRHTLHSRILLAHVACLLVSYVGLALVNLTIIPGNSTMCSVTAFTIQFTILAAIFWLNVMCVDIAWTFSGLRPPRASQTLGSDGHKYLYYSLYAWGSTIAICMVTAYLEYFGTLPLSSHLKPGFGVKTCWFHHWESGLLLVYGPIGLLLVANIALFVYTACKIQRTRRDTATVVHQQHAGSKQRDDKDRFTLYLKLFFLMGVSWIFEFISWIVGGSDSIWYVTDVINALRGVFIFMLFCLKKKVIVLAKVKLGLKHAPKFPRHPRKSTSSKLSSSMTSQRTNSFQLSHIS